ncbi:hypothetical protein OKW35_000534 [Paraburkholderia sp. MM5477-R1]
MLMANTIHILREKSIKQVTRLSWQLQIQRSETFQNLTVAFYNVSRVRGPR